MLGCGTLSGGMPVYVARSDVGLYYGWLRCGQVCWVILNLIASCYVGLRGMTLYLVKLYWGTLASSYFVLRLCCCVGDVGLCCHELHCVGSHCID